VARRLAGHERRASPLFASLGPRPARVQRYVVVELGLSGDAAVARREENLAEHRARREAHLEAWEAGRPAPPPPWAERFDTCARPAI
jgi:hypothetical protein